MTDDDLRQTVPSLFGILGVDNGILKSIYNSTYVRCHMGFFSELIKFALPLTFFASNEIDQ